MRFEFTLRPALLLLTGLTSALGCAETQDPAATAGTPAASNLARLPPPRVLQAASSPPAAAAPRPVIASEVRERLTPDADFRAKRPSPGDEPPFAVPLPKRFSIGGAGRQLPVLLLTDHRLPMVHVQLMLKTGAAADPIGKAGLAELCANMLDEGSATRSAAQIAEDLEQLGATLATRATWDSSSVSVSALSENIAPALAIWADLLLNPTFSAADLDRVRTNLLATLEQQKDSPPMVAAVVWNRALYGAKHPFGWPAIGTAATLPSITPEDLRRFHGEQYRPRNAVLVIAGDFEETDVRTTVAPLLAAWRGAAKRVAPPPAARAEDKPQIFLTNKDGAPQSSIRVGLPGIARKSPDYYRAMVMNEILGGSFRRLALNLREKRGWTYGVYSRFAAGRFAGPWVVAGEFVAEKTADSVNEILREINLLRDSDVTADELAEAKDSIIKAFPARFATARSTAAQWADLAVLDLPPSTLAKFRAAVAKVTSKDVRAMARKYLRPEGLTIAVVGDRKAHEAALAKIGTVQVRDVDGNPITP